MSYQRGDYVAPEDLRGIKRGIGLRRAGGSAGKDWEWDSRDPDVERARRKLSGSLFGAAGGMGFLGSIRDALLSFKSRILGGGSGGAVDAGGRARRGGAAPEGAASGSPAPERSSEAPPTPSPDAGREAGRKAGSAWPWLACLAAGGALVASGLRRRARTRRGPPAEVSQESGK